MKIYLSKAREIPFFDKCLSHGFKEDQERVIHLPEEDPEIVDRFLGLVLFRDRLSVEELAENFTDGSPEDLVLVRMFVLADKLSAEVQQNRLIDLLRVYHHCRGITSLRCFDVLIDAGLDTSKLFDLLVTELAFEAVLHGWQSLSGTYPDLREWLEKGGPAVRELTKKLMEKERPETQCIDGYSSLDQDDHGDRCKWHTHTSSSACDY